MAKNKPAIELVDKQTSFAKVGEYYGGKGTMGSADSRERQSRQRRTDTIKAVRSVSDDRRVGAAKTAPKTNRTSKMYQGTNNPKDQRPSRVSEDRRVSNTKPRSTSGIRLYGPAVPPKKGIRK